VLFVTSAYIIFLNPLILSGNSIGFPTGMSVEDVTLATCISTGVGTTVLALAANFPWVVSVQLGTNVYFVQSVLQPYAPCGAHSTLAGSDGACSRLPCECTGDKTNPAAYSLLAPSPECANTTNVCLGTKIPVRRDRGALLTTAHLAANAAQQPRALTSLSMLRECSTSRRSPPRSSRAWCSWPSA
jgi:AGZA family xanthine/uracil permease-like MFS transporter